MPLIFSRLSIAIKQGFMVKPLWLSTSHTRLSGDIYMYASTRRHPVHVHLHVEYLKSWQSENHTPHYYWLNQSK